MSDYYPNGYYPKLATVPAVWGTPAAAGQSVVQLNGLVYQKNARHTGGTGRPDQEVDGAGFRTWSLFEPPSQPWYVGYRFGLRLLHSCIGHPGMTYDTSTDTNVPSKYFGDGYNVLEASSNVSNTSFQSSMAAVIPLPMGEQMQGCSMGGVFTVYEPEHNPGTRYVTAIDGFNGYSSPNPGGGGGGTPPTSPVSITLDETLNFNHPWFIDRTYTGYIEQLTSTASWVWNGASYDYVIAPATVTEIPISLVADQAFLEAALAGTAQPTNMVTHNINGGLDTWVAFGAIVLRSVSPGASN